MNASTPGSNGADQSYEKTMFFLPNRLFVSGAELYVSFNVSVIPPDMGVVSAAINVPLPARTLESGLDIRTIEGAWDDNSIAVSRPPTSQQLMVAFAAPTSPEGVFDATAFIYGWRYESWHNHGLLFRLFGPETLAFAGDNPPYLLVETV